MLLKPETIAALETLFAQEAKNGAPVCAVSMQTELLWQNCGRAGELLELLRTELCGSFFTDIPVIPADGQIRVPDGEAGYQVSLPRSAQDGEPYLIAEFRRLEGLRRLTAPEMRQLLAEHDRACGRTVKNVLAAVSDSKRHQERVRRACCELLCLSERDAQLLWYESVTEELLLTLQPVEVSGIVRHAAEALQKAGGGAFHVRFSDGGTGYAKVDMHQLCAALISLFLTVQRGDSFGRDVTLSFSAAADFLTVGVTVQTGSDPAPLRAYQPDGTLISEEVLLTRFCRTFGARLLHESGDGFRVSRLLLPAVPADPDEQRLCSPLAHESVLAELYPSAQVMLERILPELPG